jgi:hypothetical protein
MRWFSGALCTAAALVLIAGCSGNGSSPTSSMPSGVGGTQTHGVGPAGFRGIAQNIIPKQFMPTHLKPIRGKRATATEMKGIYVGAFAASEDWGFTKNNSGNAPAICTVGGATSNNGIGVDNVGNFMQPNAFSGVSVYAGPAMCGALLGTFSDPYGQASDASSTNAATGTIAVGNIFDTSGQPGSVSVCTLSGGCTANLTNPNIYENAGVAINSAGDCWADSIDSSSVPTLVYFAGCTGSGVLATGFAPGYYGGLDIDNKGNLVATSLFGPGFSLPSTVNVYSGCNPACTLLSSTTLVGESIFGHVGKQGLRYVVTDLSDAAIEVYSYKPSGLSLLYSFTGGIPCATYECEAAAYDPSTNK